MSGVVEQDVTVLCDSGCTAVSERGHSRGGSSVELQLATHPAQPCDSHPKA